MKKLSAIFVVLSYGCASLQAPPPVMPDRCSAEALAALESRYIGEVLAACEGFELDTCPALPTIDLKYDAQRKAWAECPQ